MALGGLDVGNSGCKFLVYREDGSLLYESRAEYQEKGTCGRRELDPEEVMRAVLSVLKEACHNTKEKIEAFAITTLGECGIFTDIQGKPLCNCMVTGDCRGIEESREIIREFGEESLMDITGLPPSEMYSMPKFKWIKDNTDVIGKAAYLFLMEDFVAFRLTQKRKLSYSSAARTMMIDLKACEWSEEMLQYVGIDRKKVSPLCPTGEIVGNLCEDICRETGMSKETLVIAGGHDQTMSALGAGLMDNRVLEDCIGTSEVIASMLEEPVDNGFMLRNGYARIPYIGDQYLTYSILPTSGKLMNWCRDSFFLKEKEACKKQKKNVFALLDEMMPQSNSDVLVLPQFGSSGNPDIGYSVSGAISGLTIHTTPLEIYKAAKECVVFQLKMSLDKLYPDGITAEKIRVAGGGANSEKALQMRADIFQIPVEKLQNSEAGTLGCMMAAGTAVGIYANLKDALQKTVKIEKVFLPAKQNVYLAKYHEFLRLYDRMHDFS